MHVRGAISSVTRQEDSTGNPELRQNNQCCYCEVKPRSRDSCWTVISGSVVDCGSWFHSGGSFLPTLTIIAVLDPDRLALFDLDHWTHNEWSL